MYVKANFWARMMVLGKEEMNKNECKRRKFQQGFVHRLTPINRRRKRRCGENDGGVCRELGGPLGKGAEVQVWQWGEVQGPGGRRRWRHGAQASRGN